MKNVFTFLFLVFCISTSVSQISFVDASVGEVEMVGKAHTMGVVHAKLETDNNNIWILSYDYGVMGSNGFIGGPSTWEVIFNASDEDIEVLYNLFMGAFEAKNPKGYNVKINLGASKMPFVIQGHKLMGVKSVSITGNHIGEGFHLTKNHIQKLFGKR